MFEAKGTCFFCRNKNVMIVGTTLGRFACGSCFTINPTEIHWKIHRVATVIARRQYALTAPERERKRQQEDIERAERGEMKSIKEMSPKEIEDIYGRQGATLIALRNELKALPVE